jgi:hypothetical protein
MALLHLSRFNFARKLACGNQTGYLFLFSSIRLIQFINARNT